MKKNIFQDILIIFFLFASLVFHHSDARLLQAVDHQLVEVKMNHEKIIDEGSFVGTKEDFDLSDVMESDSEGCEDKDEECLKRRMVAEAHLDYIYTQKHKP